MDAFRHDHSIRAHGDTIIKVAYTNRASVVEEHINKFTSSLEKMADKIVGLDVEYTKPGSLTPQKAAVIQLCLGTDCLVYQNCKADRPCPMLAEFLGRPNITFAGVDIGNDITRLERCRLAVQNFVDIQKRWKLPDSKNEKDSLADYATNLIDKSYKTMKEGFTKDDHHEWEMVPLSMKHIRYASIDAYATYEVYRFIVYFERGQQRLAAFQESKLHSKPKRTRRKPKNRNDIVQAEEE